EFPLLPAAVEQLDAGVPVQPEVPVGVGGEPVVVPPVEDYEVIVGDAAVREQLLEAMLVHEVAADRILEILFPVELHRVGDVALVVGGGVLVHLHQYHAGGATMGFRPVGVHQDVGTAHTTTSLSGSGRPIPSGLARRVGSAHTSRSRGTGRTLR